MMPTDIHHVRLQNSPPSAQCIAWVWHAIVLFCQDKIAILKAACEANKASCDDLARLANVASKDVTTTFATEVR